MMNWKNITITFLIILVLVITIKVAVAQDVCNQTSIMTKNGCEPCAQGWNKTNETSCEFSGDCGKGRVWNVTEGFCQVVEQIKPSCVKGYKLVENKTYTTNINSSLGISYSDKYNCVPVGYWTPWRIAGVPLGILLIFVGVYQMIRNRKLKTKEG